VYEKATQLQAHARRLAEGQRGELDAQRVSQAVSETRRELNNLRSLIQIARMLGARGAPAVDLTGLDAGRTAFAAKTGEGWLPSDRAFQAAQAKIKGVASKIAADIQTAWAAHTERTLTALPMIRVPLLDPGEQVRVREQKTTLDRLAKDPKPEIPGIVQYANTLEMLRDTLDGLSDPSSEILGLMARIAGPRQISLGDLTDAEIALLRREGFADQIMLRRKNA
jgi:hypothetical protein